MMTSEDECASLSTLDIPAICLTALRVSRTMCPVSGGVDGEALFGCPLGPWLSGGSHSTRKGPRDHSRGPFDLLRTRRDSNP